MYYIVLPLLLALQPVFATPSSALDQLTGDEICALVEIELKEAVSFDIITEDEARDIALRCWINYS